MHFNVDDDVDGDGGVDDDDEDEGEGDDDDDDDGDDDDADADAACEPAQSKCIGIIHKSHLIRKFTGKMPDASPAGYT
jgi:hypothetical protein